MEAPNSIKVVIERRPASAYCLLLLAQSLAVAWLFWFVIPIFRQFVTGAGNAQDLNWRDELGITAAAVTLQTLYWTRLHLVPVWAPVRSVLAGHVVKFASRASFFFAGAFFSTIFFRHIPELDALPPVGQGMARVTLVLVLLFTLYCYSLELERLGSALESPTAGDDRSPV